MFFVKIKTLVDWIYNTVGLIKDVEIAFTIMLQALNTANMPKFITGNFIRGTLDAENL
jgi:hypothetical protein